MIVSIMQPAYLPWPGYFHRIALADLHIELDDVLIDRNSKTKFTNRNKIRTPDGWCWLTVPIESKGKTDDLFIQKLKIVSDSDWARKHWQSIKFNYAKAPFFAAHSGFLESVYLRPWERLVDLAEALNSYFLQVLEIKTRRVTSSSLAVQGSKDELILNLCREVGATIYLSGPFGRDYLNLDEFARLGIQVLFHDYGPPVYPQVHAGFEPAMSVLDLILTHGPEARSILERGQMPRPDSMIPLTEKSHQ